jgi:hypothetical protein
MKEKIINWLIKNLKADTNKINDGYHNFEELYQHRIELYMALCRKVDATNKTNVWKAKIHSDGSVWKGWFLLGINTEPGTQITYHLPIKYWNKIEVIDWGKAPNFDGHTPKDVIKRLKNL